MNPELALLELKLQQLEIQRSTASVTKDYPVANKLVLLCAQCRQYIAQIRVLEASRMANKGE